MEVAIGIDIGGTNTKWGFVDNNGHVLQEGGLSTTAYHSPDDMVAALSENIKNVLDNHPIDYQLMGIGIGAPNGNFYKGTIEHAPNLEWKGIVPLRNMFKERFDLPIWLTNDANAAAIGEMQFGAAQGEKDFLVVTLGTGLGSGFVANGNLIYGHDAFAGELGHTIIEIDGRSCGCGRKGCLETYASATGMVRTAKLFLKEDQSNSRLHKYLEKNLSARVIGDAAAKGDELALKIFDYTAEKLGFALSNAVAITSPSVIVLFGGVANAGDLILKPTKKYMEKYMLNLFKDKVSLKISEVSEQHAAILGAGALVWEHL